MPEGQLNIFMPPLSERVTIKPTRDVLYRGAGAEAVPVHEHVPAPRPRAMPTDADWLGTLALAERCIRWKRWTTPHPLPLDSRPEECVGGSSRHRYDSKGVAVMDGTDWRYASWPVLLRGLPEQREHEPHIADARDLAHAYHAAEQYDRFYVRDGGSVPGGDRDGWRERVAVPHLAKLRAIIEKLGGDPDLAVERERLAA